MAKYKVRRTFVDGETRERHAPGTILNISKARGDNLVARRLVEAVETPKREESVETANKEPAETAAKRTKADE